MGISSRARAQRSGAPNRARSSDLTKNDYDYDYDYEQEQEQEQSQS